MNEETRMQCPHCDHVGEIIWIGFATDFVLCEACTQRILWAEVRYSVWETEEDAWNEPMSRTAMYN